jgi:hypothetical protein
VQCVQNATDLTSCFLPACLQLGPSSSTRKKVRSVIVRAINGGHDPHIHFFRLRAHVATIMIVHYIVEGGVTGYSITGS